MAILTDNSKKIIEQLISQNYGFNNGEQTYIRGYLKIDLGLNKVIFETIDSIPFYTWVLNDDEMLATFTIDGLLVALPISLSTTK